MTYQPADVRSLSWWRSAFPEQNLTVYAGGEWLFHNQTYFVRPDNSGRALFRHVAHADLNLYWNRVVLFVDAISLRAEVQPMSSGRVNSTWLWDSLSAIRRWRSH